MRDASDMMGLILGWADNDERVRAVILGGSRANPAAPRDRFQDYDVLCFVSEVGSFTRDWRWLDRFGERVIMQAPDALDDPDGDHSIRFAFLMQFVDGNRLDLTLHRVSALSAATLDQPSIVLRDKDDIVRHLSPPQYHRYVVRPPTAPEFMACCNEFWWVSTYVVKGLWRHELPYVKSMYDGPVREMLHRMLGWWVGARTGFTADSGKAGRHLQRHLPPEVWAQYLHCLPDGDYEHIWAGLFAMGDLFRLAATAVAADGGWAYPGDDEERVMAYWHWVRGLEGSPGQGPMPADA